MIVTDNMFHGEEPKSGQELNLLDLQRELAASEEVLNAARLSALSARKQHQEEQLDLQMQVRTLTERLATHRLQEHSKHMHSAEALQEKREELQKAKNEIAVLEACLARVPKPPAEMQRLAEEANHVKERLQSTQRQYEVLSEERDYLEAEQVRMEFELQSGMLVEEWEQRAELSLRDVVNAKLHVLANYEQQAKDLHKEVQNVLHGSSK
mmetsp:Transcript_25746/g.59538  ORF Transcript_25746/g.59538 Transcript_25746/m.59538 type:complete len:210 (+) Transcript_25746:107-736(+)